MAGRKHKSCYHVGYSLSCAEYDDLRRLARNRCKICKAETDPLYIDHDHARGTWAVRGLVCHSCNQQLRRVDAGTKPRTPAIARYLRHAWHLRQDTAAKEARVRMRMTCPVCGRNCAVKPNGQPYRHWSRLPGLGETLCTAAPPTD